MPLKMTKRLMKIEPALNGAVSVAEAVVAMAMAIGIYDVLVDTMEYLAFGLMNGADSFADETFVVVDIAAAAAVVVVVADVAVAVADDGVVADAFVPDDELYLAVRCLSRSCVLCSSKAAKKPVFDYL